MLDRYYVTCNVRMLTKKKMSLTFNFLERCYEMRKNAWERVA